MSTTSKMRFSFLSVAAFALIVSLSLVNCGGGEGGGVTPPAKWTGTKQLGVAGTYTEATGVAVDAGGNVYVAGQTRGGLDGNTLTGLGDFFVTKYDPAGNKQ